MSRVLLVLAVVALFSGCSERQSKQVAPLDVVPAEDVPVAEQTLPADTTSSTLKSVADYGGVSVMVAGCDDDYEGNAMVGGVVVNNGVRTLGSVPVVTQLLDGSGALVPGGEKSTVIEGLNPGETRKFSVLYERPRQWRSCRAYVGS